MTDSGLPPAGYTSAEVTAFERACLRCVRQLLAPGAPLSAESSRIFTAIDLERTASSVDIVVRYTDGDPEPRVMRFAVWAPDPTPPDPRDPNMARQVATMIAINAIEP